jgi:hypothetical protein
MVYSCSPHFSEKDLADLTLAVVLINGWNRSAISSAMSQDISTQAQGAGGCFNVTVG